MATITRSDSAQALEIEDVTASKTIDRNDLPRLYTNAGAGGAVTITLPPDPKGGEVVEVVTTVAASIVITAGPTGSPQIFASNGSAYTLQAVAATISNASALGESIKLVAVSPTRWVALKQTTGLEAPGFDAVA